MIMPYLEFNGKCEEAFHFYADILGGEITSLTRMNNDPNNTVMHACVTFAQFDGAISGADVIHPVKVSGVAILLIIPSRKKIEEVVEKLSVGGTVIQRFMPHPPPDDQDGGAAVRDKYGFTWCLST